MSRIVKAMNIPEGYYPALSDEFFRKRYGGKAYDLVYNKKFFSLRGDGSWEGFEYTTRKTTNFQKLWKAVSQQRIFIKTTTR